MDIEQHGPRGVGHVGRVDPPPGQFPEQPAVDRPEAEFAPLRAFERARNVLEDPFEFGRGKVGIGQKPGLFPDGFGKTRRPQRLAARGGPAALPDDGAVDRLPGLSVPDDRGLALIGDADRAHAAPGRPGFQERLRRDPDLRRPDLHRIVFDPSLAGKVLRELVRGGGDDPAALVKEDAAGTGRPLIQRHQIVRHSAILSGRNPNCCRDKRIQMQNPRSRSEGVYIYVERARTGIEKARFSKKDWRLSVLFGFYGIKSNRYFRSYIQQPCFFVLR